MCEWEWVYVCVCVAGTVMNSNGSAKSTAVWQRFQFHWCFSTASIYGRPTKPVFSLLWKRILMEILLVPLIAFFSLMTRLLSLISFENFPLLLCPHLNLCLNFFFVANHFCIIYISYWNGYALCAAHCVWMSKKWAAKLSVKSGDSPVSKLMTGI